MIHANYYLWGWKIMVVTPSILIRKVSMLNGFLNPRYEFFIKLGQIVKKIAKEMLKITKITVTVITIRVGLLKYALMILLILKTFLEKKDFTKKINLWKCWEKVKTKRESWSELLRMFTKAVCLNTKHRIINFIHSSINSNIISKILKNLFCK